jgi:thiopeptide-type bacteriocin biosynthesis protein
MRTRPTPFGTFAGVADGRFDTSAKLEWGDRHRTRTHVDMHWLLAVVHELEADAALLPALTVRVHPAVTLRGDRVVLDCPSPRPAAGGADARATVSVRHSPVVAEVLRHAADTIPLDVLADRLRERFAAPADRVAELLRVLVGEEVLVTGLRPPLDGGDPLRHVVDLLSAVPAPSARSAEILEVLRELDRGRVRFDASPVGAGQDDLAALTELAHRLDPYATPLHVDTALDVAVRLPYEVRAEVERAVDLMWHTSRDKLGFFPLRGYHATFLERYGTDRLVPILELLDGARGIGAPAGYAWPAAEAAGEDPVSPRDADRTRLIHRIVATATRRGCREVELTDDMVAALTPTEPDPATVPNSCELTVHVVAPSLDALSSGEFQIVLAPGPGSHMAGATFARFADLLPGCADTLAAEGAALPVHVTDAIHAAIAYLPRSGKAANLAHTVSHGDARISVGLPDGCDVREIRLADVGIGATLDRLCAVHLPTGREIVPVLGNMVSAVAQAPNAARLLWEIGLEGQRLWEPWNWGPLVDAPFVPRIRRGRFVLAPAMWRLDVLRGVPAEEFPAAVARWRVELDVPHRVLLVSRDQRLLVDLTDPWHLELLRDDLRKDDTLVAHEIPGDDGLTDGIGGHLTEVVVPLSRRAVAPRRPAHVAHHDPDRTRSGLGGEWLFLKLYSPSRGQDELLLSHLPVLIGQARARGAERWFFIRYTDAEGHHLRVRLHGRPEALWGDVARGVGDTLDGWRSQGLVRAVRVDEYEPEAERYGGAGVSAAVERVFEADSDAALALLDIAAGPGGPTLDACAVVSLAALAQAFGPPAPDAPRAALDCGDDAAAAWLSLTGTRRALPELYRKEAARWRRIVDPYGGWSVWRSTPGGPAVLDALAERDAAVSRLRDQVGASRTPHGRLVASLMHMTCNRLFGGDPDREAAVSGVARGAVQDNQRRRRRS